MPYINGKDKDKLFEALDNAFHTIGKDKVLTYQRCLKSRPDVVDPARRFRWDMFWASNFKIADGIGIREGDITLPDCKDAHIDTALRSWMDTRLPSLYAGE